MLRCYGVQLHVDAIFRYSSAKESSDPGIFNRLSRLKNAQEKNLIARSEAAHPGPHKFKIRRCVLHTCTISSRVGIGIIDYSFNHQFQPV